MSSMNTHCPVCNGLGTRTLPQRLVSPGVVDLMHRTEACEACGGTGDKQMTQQLTQNEMQAAARAEWQHNPHTRYFWSPGVFVAFPDPQGNPICEQRWGGNTPSWIATPEPHQPE